MRDVPVSWVGFIVIFQPFLQLAMLTDPEAAEVSQRAFQLLLKCVCRSRVFPLLQSRA